MNLWTTIFCTRNETKCQKCEKSKKIFMKKESNDVK